MKKLLLVIALFIAAYAQAQTIRVPIDMSFELPIQSGTNGTIIINNITTNIYLTITTNVEVTVLDQRVTTNTYVTNITFITQITTNASTDLVTITNNVIDPKLGIRLFRIISSPSVFTTSNFSPSSFTTLYYSNPSKFKLVWPTGTWWLGPMPTNQARGAVLFENVNGELWATP
jgi:hypothetical protein